MSRQQPAGKSSLYIGVTVGALVGDAIGATVLILLKHPVQSPVTNAVYEISDL